MKKWLFFLFLTVQMVFAQTPPPNPLDLKSGWFTYFTEQGADPKARMKEVTDNLQTLVKNLPPESKEALEPLVNKIESNLSAYQLSASQPPQVAPPIPPIQNNYTVNDLIRLNRELRNRNIIFANDQEDFNQRKIQIASAEEKLLALRRKYNDVEPRSQEKFALGLELMDLGISLELAKEKQKILNDSIAIDKELVNRVDKELATALSRINSNPEELKEAESAQTEAKSKWETETSRLREQEANSITAFNFAQGGDVAKLSNQLLSQKVTSAQIDEALAYNSYLFNLLKVEFSKFLANPTSFSPTELASKLKSWRDWLSQNKKSTEDWELEIKRDIQRAEEWLSVNVDAKDEASEAIRKLQTEITNVAEHSLVNLIRLSSESQDTDFLLQNLSDRAQSQIGGVESIYIGSWELIKSFFSNIGDILTYPLFSFGDQVIDAGDILQFFLILAASVWVARLVRMAINRFAEQRQGVKPSLLYRINRLFSYLIVALGFMLALSAIGFNFSNFVLIAGALGVGLGFGLQTLFNNFVSGLVILFENQLKVGDYIELESGLRGEVKEINVRSTYIRTNDGIAVMVPNSEFTTGRVINWTHTEPYRRVRIYFSVHYDTDKELVKKIIKDAVSEVPLTLKKSWVPEPRVFIDKLGDSSIEFKVMVWVNEQATKRSSYTKSAYLWAIHDTLKANGIEVPYPQMDVHFDDSSKLTKS